MSHSWIKNVISHSFTRFWIINLTRHRSIPIICRNAEEITAMRSIWIPPEFPRNRTTQTRLGYNKLHSNQLKKEVISGTWATLFSIKSVRVCLWKNDWKFFGEIRYLGSCFSEITLKQRQQWMFYSSHDVSDDKKFMYTSLVSDCILNENHMTIVRGSPKCRNLNSAGY